MVCFVALHWAREGGRKWGVKSLSCDASPLPSPPLPSPPPSPTSARGCFDEFNRLEEKVLSAISQQIQAIQASLKGRAASVELLGRPVDVDPNAGIFVTMNPAGKGSVCADPRSPLPLPHHHFVNAMKTP